MEPKKSNWLELEELLKECGLQAYWCDEQGHGWIKRERDQYLRCRKCGVVKRSDGKNSQCRGPVKISLRTAEKT